MYNYDIKCKVIEEELRSVWPEWHVICRLGGGAFGDVFQVFKEKYEIRVDSALKVIQVIDNETTKTQPLNDPDATEDETAGQNDIPDSLRREIEIMETLRGAPNVVNIEDFYFRREGTTCSLFVRMELLTSLKEVLSGGNGQHTLFSIQEIRKLGKDICTALMHCENKGIIHRDIKPANLFVDKFGHYKVGDFGASKRMDTVHESQTMTGIGTISYMAPEIFRGRSYNNTVDIYALGLVLYQLLNNGRLPFLPTEGSYTTQDIDNANYMRLHGTPVPSLEGNVVGGERIDSRLDAVVRKACAADSADRYQIAKEFYDALILTETEAKSGAEFEEKQQSLQTPESSLQSKEVLTDAEAKGGVESEEKQQSTSQIERSSDSQQKETRRPVKKTLLIAVVPLLILVVAGLAVLLGRERFSSDENTSAAAQAEEKTGSDLAIDTSSGDDSTDIVEIPDPVLKKAIQDALEIGDREITKEDALSLTFLNSNSSRQIKDITGLSEFKNLATLYLEGTQISDISELSGLTNLEELFLSDNQISDITALSVLINLKKLRLSYNQISDITSLSDLENLTNLDLWNNQISDISALSGLNNLTYLRLMENQISDISALSGLTNLTKMEIYNNQISDISALSGLTNLTKMEIYNNQISDISALAGLKNLTYLRLDSNQISDISSLSGLTNLTYLDLSFNPISDISALSGLTNLKGLSLWDTQISDISTLSNLKNLMNLELIDNQISDISALSGLVNLTSLGLGYNQISDINALSGLTNLTSLFLENNQIDDISALSDLTNLENLDLRFNPVVLNYSREEIMEVLSGAENLTNLYLY